LLSISMLPSLLIFLQIIRVTLGLDK
jgi:hypothetical protein